MKKDFWDKFTEALRTKGERRPEGEGWATPEELGKRWKKNMRLTRRMLNDGRRAGLLEFFDGNTFRDGKRRRTVWYREAK